MFAYITNEMQSIFGNKPPKKPLHENQSKLKNKIKKYTRTFLRSMDAKINPNRPRL